jgi:hypothetical protein
MLSATTAAIILATAMGPIVSPGSEARGNARHGHAQHQATERGTGPGSQHPQVASAGTKGHTKQKKKGSHRSGHGHSGTVFNPTSPTAPHGPYYTQTLTFTNHCIAYEGWGPGGPDVDCGLFGESIPPLTPVQVEVIATLPCGTATVWITTLDGQPLATRQGLQSGVSSGVIDLGVVTNFEIGVQLSTFEGCGPIPRTGFPYTLTATTLVTTLGPPYPGTPSTPVPVLTP